MCFTKLLQESTLHEKFNSVVSNELFKFHHIGNRPVLVCCFIDLDVTLHGFMSKAFFNIWLSTSFIITANGSTESSKSPSSKHNRYHESSACKQIIKTAVHRSSSGRGQCRDIFRGPSPQVRDKVGQVSQPTAYYASISARPSAIARQPPCTPRFFPSDATSVSDFNPSSTAQWLVKSLIRGCALRSWRAHERFQIRRQENLWKLCFEESSRMVFRKGHDCKLVKLVGFELFGIDMNIKTEF